MAKLPEPLHRTTFAAATSMAAVLAWVPASEAKVTKIQILSIRELLEEHKKPMLPLLLMPTYQQAERIPTKQAAEQRELFG